MYDFAAFDKKIAATKEWLIQEFSGIRTGRAAPALLDSVQVNAYGSRSPLKQIANVGVEEARILRVSAYDPSLIKEIEKAIVAADLGVGTSTDGTTVRVTFPELTGERRTQLLKLAKQKLEDARTTLRHERDEIWSDIQLKEREGTLTEDDKFSLKDELQKKIDGANKSLEESYVRKEQEITS